MGKGGKGGGGKQAASNRSNSMNPNNLAHHAATNNRSNQGNPNNPAYRSSRAGSSGSGAPGRSSSPPPAGWKARPGCELCENTGPHDGPHGHFAEGDFYPFDDGVPEDDDE